MATICSPTFFPTYTDISDLLSPYYAYADLLTLPSQYTLPDPPWNYIYSPQQSLEQTITEMIQSQLASVYEYFFSVFEDFLNINPLDYLPPIPGFEDFNLYNVLQGEIQDMIDTIDEYFDYSLISLLPDPIYPYIDSNPWEILTTVQTAISENYQAITTVVQDLIDEVGEKLGHDWDGLDDLIPPYPTLDDIYELIYDYYDSLSLPVPEPLTLEGLLNIIIPGWNYQLIVPDPLIPNVFVPQYDFLQGLKNMYNGMATQGMEALYDFVADKVDFFDDLPVFCLEIPEIPEP